MSKKMKGVAFGDDVRARFKHQTLVQSYLQLNHETEAARNNLAAMKQKKQTLEAEVRFLRRRHKFLLKTNSSTPKEIKYHNLETIQHRKSKKDKVNAKKTATLPNLPPIPNPNRRGNMYSKKKNGVPSRPPLVFDLEPNVDFNGFNLNQRVFGNYLSLGSEFGKKESGFGGKETGVQSNRAPKFDLNQISVEEDDDEVEESFNEQSKEHQNDLQVSICRNAGDNSANRSGKRKISWQDPVALSV